MPVRKGIQSTEIFVPLGGLNTKDPLENLSPQYSHDLVNWLPRTSTLELRKGTKWFSTPFSSPVETLFQQCTNTGEKRFYACGGGSIYNITAGGTGVLARDGLLNNRWSTAQVNGTLVLLNGEDNALRLLADNSIVPSNFTNASLSSDSTLVHATNYKGRIYMTQKDSTDVYYTSLGGSAGAVEVLSLGFVLQCSASIAYCTSWTRDTGTRSEELFVVVAESGETLVYSGSDPTASNWTLVSQFFLGRPMSRQSYTHIGSDLILITENGCYPLGSLLSLGTVNEYGDFSDKINPTFNRLAQSTFDFQAWQSVVSEKSRLAIINVPSFSGKSTQLAINPQSRAWTTLKGWNARSMLSFDGNIYYGDFEGNIYQIDVGSVDEKRMPNGSIVNLPISHVLATAYNRFKSSDVKRMLECQPIIRVSNSVELEIGVDVDFQQQPVYSYVKIEVTKGASWDSSDWNEESWAGGQQYNERTFGIAGRGRAVSIYLSGTWQDTISSLSSLRVSYTFGGIR